MSIPDEFYTTAGFPELSETEKAVHLIWYLNEAEPKLTVTVSELTRLFEEIGLPRPNPTRLRGRLAKDRRTITKSDGGVVSFSLHRDIRQEFSQRFNQFVNQDSNRPLIPLAKSLEKHAERIINPAVKLFVEEAVGCLNSHHLRAAVVLSWQGAYAVLVDYTFTHFRDTFSSEAQRRGFIKKKIESVDGFQRLKESEALLCMEASGVISKAVKIELENCLSRRNNCGHPNDFVIGEAQVAGHIESLISHVYIKFS